MVTAFYTLPTMTAGGSINPRNIFTTVSSAKFVPSTEIIDGALSRDSGQSNVTGGTPSLLRYGLIMGKVTSGGKYRPSILGLNRTAMLNSATTLGSSAGCGIEVTRLGLPLAVNVVGPPTAAGTVATTLGTITAAVYGATTSTLTLSGSLGVAYAVGSYISPSDGAGVPATILAESPTGVDVADVTGTSIDQALSKRLIGGDMISANIVSLLTDDLGTTTDASVVTYIKGKLQANGQQFTFNDDR